MENLKTYRRAACFLVHCARGYRFVRSPRACCGQSQSQVQVGEEFWDRHTFALERAISGAAEEGVHMLSAVNQTDRVTHPVHANHLTGQCSDTANSRKSCVGRRLIGRSPFAL